MGLFDKFFCSTSKQYIRRVYESPKKYTPEEYVIYEQEQSEESWHGVLLCELSKLAQETHRGRYVKIGKDDNLVFYYSSNSGKTKFYAYCKLNKDGRLALVPHDYYPGQWCDSSDEFVEKANQNFAFR